MTVIGINAALMQARKHGISRYVTQLVTHLDQIETGKLNFKIYTDSETHDLTDFTRIPVNYNTTLRRILWDTIGFTRTTQSTDVDLIHSPDKGPIYRSDTPVVTTIHDLLPFYFAEERGFLNRRYWQILLQRQVNISDAIICVSHSTKNDIIDRFGTSGEKIYVTHLGTDLSPPSKKDIRSTTKKYDILDSQFNILYVGNYDQRKNVDKIVRACRSIHQDFPELRLILAGSNPPKSTLNSIAGEFHDKISYLGYVPDSELGSLYAAADVFTYPSEYEGFGLPIIEAMACGTPVITSNKSSLPEVGGEAAVTLDPSDLSTLSAAIRRMCEDDEFRKTMQDASLRRAQDMRWDQTARETVRVYHELL